MFAKRFALCTVFGEVFVTDSEATHETSNVIHSET